MLYDGQDEEKTAVMVMGRHANTSQFAFSDKGNTSEMEREDIMAKLRPTVSGGTAHTTTLK
jgi:hypothetical protein